MRDGCVARLFSLMDMRLLYAPCSVFSCYPFFPGFFVLSGLIHQGQFNVELSSCISQIHVHPLRVSAPSWCCVRKTSVGSGMARWLVLRMSFAAIHFFLGFFVPSGLMHRVNPASNRAPDPLHLPNPCNGLYVISESCVIVNRAPADPECVGVVRGTRDHTIRTNV